MRQRSAVTSLVCRIGRHSTCVADRHRSRTRKPRFCHMSTRWRWQEATICSVRLPASLLPGCNSLLWMGPASPPRLRAEGRHCCPLCVCARRMCVAAGHGISFCAHTRKSSALCGQRLWCASAVGFVLACACALLTHCGRLAGSSPRAVVVLAGRSQ